MKIPYEAVGELCSEKLFTGAVLNQFGCISRIPARTGISAAQRWGDARTHGARGLRLNDLLSSSHPSGCQSHKEIFNHTCSASIRSKCMLAFSSARAFMQNLVCRFKIIVCLFAVFASPQSRFFFFFFVHWSFSMLVDDKPNGGSEGRAYLFHKTTSNLLFWNNVQQVYLWIYFLF